MKTLVIHPEDSTTDFLKVIYEGKNWTIINDNEISKSKLKREIIEHDRIVMLGHGTERGLFGGNYRSIITSDLVYLLREKECVAIWCNADEFVKKYNIKGFYSGMIISDYMEANLYCITATDSQIETSNELFAQSIKNSIDLNGSEKLETARSLYNIENPIVEFNRENLYYNMV